MIGKDLKLGWIEVKVVIYIYIELRHGHSPSHMFLHVYKSPW